VTSQTLVAAELRRRKNLARIALTRQNQRSNEMKEYEERKPTARAPQRLERTDLLLSQLQADLRMGRVPEGLTPEQRAALARVETTLDAYASFFYPHDPRQ
jgi:hypothetical protein